MADTTKDPNILNELGHTNYPKYVYPNVVTDEDGKVKNLGPGIIVKDKAEEDKAMGNDKKPQWTK